MKIKIKTIELLNGLKKVSGATWDVSSQPILKNVLIETQKDQIKLTGTNLDLRIETIAPCEVIKEGKFTLPAQKFTQIVNTFDKEITIEVKDGIAEISEGKSCLKIQGLPADEYPDITEADSKDFIEIHSSSIIKGLEKTIVCVNGQAGNQIISGISVIITKNKIEFCGTDGNRLSTYSTEIKTNKEARSVIPRITAQEILKIAGQNQDAKLYIEKSRIKIDFGNTVLYSSILEGLYPAYEQLIPKELPNVLKINKGQLASIIRKAQTISENKSTNGIVLDINTNKVDISFKSPNGELQELLLVPYTGESIKTCIADNFFSDLIKSLETEEIEMHMSIGNASIVFRPVGSGEHLHLIMPIGLKQ